MFWLDCIINLNQCHCPLNLTLHRNLASILQTIPNYLVYHLTVYKSYHLFISCVFYLMYLNHYRLFDFLIKNPIGMALFFSKL